LGPHHDPPRRFDVLGVVPSSACPPVSCETGWPLPRPWRHLQRTRPETAARLTDTTLESAVSRVAPPMEFQARSAFWDDGVGVSGLRRRSTPTCFMPFRSRCFSHPQRLGPPRPRCHFQTTDARRVPASSLHDLRRYCSRHPSELCSSKPLVPIRHRSGPPRRFSAALPYRCRSCLTQGCVPEGCWLFRSGLPNPRPCFRTSAEGGSLGRFVPSWRSRHRLGAFRPIRPWSFLRVTSKLNPNWTFDVFPPVPWRCRP